MGLIDENYARNRRDSGRQGVRCVLDGFGVGNRHAIGETLNTSGSEKVGRNDTIRFIRICRRKNRR